MTDFIYWLGDVFYLIFGLLEKLENLPNIIFILLGFGGLFFWLNTQGKFNKKAQEQGTLK